MKIINVVSSVYNEAAGPAYSVPKLCLALAANQAEVELHTLAPLPKLQNDYKTIGYRHIKFPYSALGLSPAMHRGLKTACRNAQIIHSHVLWMLPNIYPEFARRNSNCKHVISPRGTFSQWAWERSRWKKKIMLMLGQQANLKHAEMFHATGQQEYEEIRQLGFKQPITIIPNGIDIPARPEKMQDKTIKQLVFMSRIHPKKGIDMLLQAWRSIQNNHLDWELLIVGPECDYQAQMIAMAQQIAAERVQFTGGLTGAVKIKQLFDADLFVLPTHSENFGMVIAEALACGTPVITTKGTPWNGLPREDAGWWIDIGEKPLAECLDNALSLPKSRLAEMGENGRKWMMHDFEWNEIGRKMLLSYQWLIDGGTVPDWIIVN